MSEVGYRKSDFMNCTISECMCFVCMGKASAVRSLKNVDNPKAFIIVSTEPLNWDSLSATCSVCGRRISVLERLKLERRLEQWKKKKFTNGSR